MGVHACATTSTQIPQLSYRYHLFSSLETYHSQHLGWLTVIGWQAAIATANYVSAAIVQGLVILTRPEYQPQPFHTVFLFWAVMAFAIFVVTVLSPVLPKFEGLVMLLHVLGFFAVMLPLVILGDHQDPYAVFGQFLNEGSLPTQGISMIVGMIGPVFMFLGTRWQPFSSR